MTLALILGVSFVSGSRIDVNAADMTGTVSVNDSLNVRKGPGTSYARVGALSSGDKVIILETAYDTDKAVWFKIKYNGSSVGYVHSKYITIDKELPEYVPDADFENYLTTQGFHESYKPYLRQLHAQYPEWVFVADKIPMTWDYVLDEECVLGRNLVASSSIDSWKSMETGAYDWTTNKWIGLDGSSWVAASRSIIAYYLDPRNFLTAQGVFQFLSHSYYPENQTLEGLKKMVAGSFLAGAFPEKGYETYSDALIYAAKQSKVNPYVLASMILVEQGNNGTGKSISGKVSGYEGYYNYFNVRAYAHGGYDAVQYGLLYAKGSGSYGRPWNTRLKSIVGGATYYGNNYVNLGQDTLYYKKFNVVNSSSGYFTYQYMTNIQGAELEGNKLAKAYAGMLDSPLVFSIPVYKSMSDTVAVKPTSTGNNNNYLSSLSVKGYSLTPTFNMKTLAYEIIVENNVTEISVTAKAVNTKANVAVKGNTNLAVGANKVTVSVTATSGEVRNYIITVTRKGSSGESPYVEPSVTTKYKIDSGNMTGIAPGTTVANFTKSVSVKNGSFKLLDKDGKAVTGGNISTGQTFVLLDSDSKVFYKRTIIILGDNNGDGKISITDLARTQKNILNVTALTEPYLKAADVNRDGKVSIVDLAKIQKHILGVETIAQ